MCSPRDENPARLSAPIKRNRKDAALDPVIVRDNGAAIQVTLRGAI